MVVTEIPELGLVSTHHSDDSLGQNTDQHQQETTSSEQFTPRPFWDTDDGGVHVHLHPEDGFSQHGEESEQEVKLVFTRSYIQFSLTATEKPLYTTVLSCSPCQRCKHSSWYIPRLFALQFHARCIYHHPTKADSR